MTNKRRLIAFWFQGCHQEAADARLFNNQLPGGAPDNSQGNLMVEHQYGRA
jgi:hypothetical protein